MNHVSIFKGQHRRFALSELVQAWYKTFPPAYFVQVEINDSTTLRNKTSTAQYICVEDQILERKILGTTFYIFVLIEVKFFFEIHTPVREHK